MSSWRDFFMGADGQPGQVFDLTPDEFAELRGPISQFLMQQLFNPAQWGGPFAAGMTDAEGGILSQLQGFSPMTGFQQHGLDQLQGIAAGDFLHPDSNPFLQASIETAQRPLLERFGQQMGDARGQFTQAGHFVSPGASSPFQTAEAQLQTGLANAMGDVGTRMASDNLARERQLQQQAIGMGAGIEQGMNQFELQSMLANLEAQALPRMIEQMGIDRGLQEFQRQQQQMMALLGMGGELASPTPQMIPGFPGAPGALHGFLGGMGSGLGSWMGSAMAGGGSGAAAGGGGSGAAAGGGAAGGGGGGATGAGATGAAGTSGAGSSSGSAAGTGGASATGAGAAAGMGMAMAYADYTGSRRHGNRRARARGARAHPLEGMSNNPFFQQELRRQHWEQTRPPDPILREIERHHLHQQTGQNSQLSPEAQQWLSDNPMAMMDFDEWYRDVHAPNRFEEMGQAGVRPTPGGVPISGNPMQNLRNFLTMMRASQA